MAWQALLFMAASGYRALSLAQEGREAKALHDARADMYDLDATAEREAGHLRARKVRDAGEGARSDARGGYAASNIEVDTGTALKVDQEIAALSEQDALTEILYGEKRAQAADRSAAYERAAGVQAKKAGKRNAFGSLLGAGAELGSGWLGGGGKTTSRMVGS